MNKRVFVGDFETSVYDGQTSTEVWASAVVELGSEDVKILHSIEDTYEYLKSIGESIIIYYHNLKFDGSFWLDFLIKKGLKQAYNQLDNYQVEWQDNKDMKNNTYKYMISEMGQWYDIVIKVNNHFIEIRDSLKLLPFSVRRIGEAFKTKHQKLDMEYKGYRYAGCTITDEEKEYIANDVLVVKEALELMQEENHLDLTIGACCLKEFKKTFHDKSEYNGMFPDLTKIELDKEIYGSDNVDAYIRKSYKGGWCYCVKGKENQVKHNGTTADVNSLYPSMMHSESGNRYPYGKPTFWKGNYIPEEALEEHKYYFIRVRTRFYIKENHLPCIQIKGNRLYRSTENLESSDVYYNGKYYDSIVGLDGVIEPTIVELTLTMTDYKLIQDHYNLVDFEILDGCYFKSLIGVFDTYIDTYKKIKQESKGAKRELAKLFLNNLYGKMASSNVSSFKVAFYKDNSVAFIPMMEYNKKVGYIPIGSAITSYARNFTIRSAQQNYYGADKKGFIYADTDSIHCDLMPNEIKGIKVHPTDFCCWKLESCWDDGIFVRQKTYIEHIVKEDGEDCMPYYNVKCAGMPSTCKDLFVYSMEQNYTEEYYNSLNKEEQDFVKTKRDITDFKIGLKINGKLLPKRIDGGIILVDTTYEMR